MRSPRSMQKKNIPAPLVVTDRSGKSSKSMDPLLPSPKKMIFSKPQEDAKAWKTGKIHPAFKNQKSKNGQKFSSS